MRTCKVCGGEYRGLVCQACHPRGSGERGKRRYSQDETGLRAADLRDAQDGTGDDSYSNRFVSEGEGATAVAVAGMD